MIAGDGVWVIPYDPEWPERFRDLGGTLRQASIRSTTISSRCRACAANHCATTPPKRPSRVLPMMIANRSGFCNTNTLLQKSTAGAMRAVKVNLKSRPAQGYHGRMEPELTIGALSNRTGVATSALRFYEAQGLIHATRSAGGQRRYPRSTLRRVSFIRVAQHVGLSLEEIRSALASLPENRTPDAKDWHRLSMSWRPRLDAQIALLERLRDRLDGCIGCGCLSLAFCKLLNPDDVAARSGPGPRYLLDGESSGRFPAPPDHPGWSPTATGREGSLLHCDHEPGKSLPKPSPTSSRAKRL